MKKLILNLLPVVVCMQLSAQSLSNPYASIGKKAPKIATVTNGEYEEFFEKDSLVQVGTTIMNRNTGEVAFFAEDNSEKFKQFTEHSEKNFRFLSIDPLTKKYPELTPYQFASNRPIDGIDLDGLEHVRYYYKQKADGTYTQLGPPKALDVFAKNSQGYGVQVRLVGLDGKVKDVFVPTNAPPKPAPPTPTPPPPTTTTTEKIVEVIDAVTPAMDNTAEGFTNGGTAVAGVSALARQPAGVVAGAAGVATGAVVGTASTILKATKAVINEEYLKAAAIVSLAFISQQVGNKIKASEVLDKTEKVVISGATNNVSDKVEDVVVKSGGSN